MKKNIFILLVLLLIAALSIFFVYQVLQKTNKKKEKWQSIPSFSLLDIDGNRVTEKALRKNTPTLFLFFDSECDLCHTELNDINSNQNALSKCQMIFFSTQPADSIRSFLESISFNHAPNMFFLVDEDEELIETMEIQATPTAIIYDKNGILSKRFNGPVKIETLINYLSK
jgi:Uncharacterized protein SCO1/SenC/PrrC, involved in biogenesis of respiratory and photosynthetic systems